MLASFKTLAYLGSVKAGAAAKPSSGTPTVETRAISTAVDATDDRLARACSAGALWQAPSLGALTAILARALAQTSQKTA